MKLQLIRRILIINMAMKFKEFQKDQVLYHIKLSRPFPCSDQEENRYIIINIAFSKRETDIFDLEKKLLTGWSKQQLWNFSSVPWRIKIYNHIGASSILTVFCAFVSVNLKHINKRSVANQKFQVAVPQIFSNIENFYYYLKKLKIHHPKDFNAK